LPIGERYPSIPSVAASVVGTARALTQDLAVGARFAWGVARFLRHPIDAAQARAALQNRLARREADFIDLVRHGIYANPRSPYARLLAHAGCEPGDFERLVRADGVDGALHALYRAGVYLTVDEFKSRRPVERSGLQFTVDPADLRFPGMAVHLSTHSSGSRGAGTAVPIDFATIRDRLVNTCLVVETRGGGSWPKAIWGSPGGSVVTAVRFSGFGAPLTRWFLQIDPRAPGLHRNYRRSILALRAGSLAARRPLPWPEYVPLDDPLPIVRWMTTERAAGRTPHLCWAYPSSAVRLAEAALAAGLGLEGVQMTLLGEPITEARLAAIRRAGAHAVPAYGSGEAGLIANGCLAPAAPDDVHLYRDLQAMIQPGIAAARPGLPRKALLISSLRPTAALVLLNVSMGDQAEMDERGCGCPLAELGWTSHLSGIRSYEKLTAGGMTFLDTDVIRVLEDVLPARFGGGPTDYQLVEEEGPSGRPHVRLLVHPAVGPFDPAVMVDAFLTAIGGGSGVERIMELEWRQSGILEVRRQPPRLAPSGKISHLHVEPRAARGAAAGGAA
jgi:hypothetical protein